MEEAARSITARGRFAVALSGGGTPRRTYELLATGQFRDRVNWQQVHIFWGDERGVPPEDSRSNYRLAKKCLLEHVPLPPEHVHPIPAFPRWNWGPKNMRPSSRLFLGIRPLTSI
jgi:6-phosphogluconolactonase